MVLGLNEELLSVNLSTKFQPVNRVNAVFFERKTCISVREKDYLGIIDFDLKAFIVRED